MEGMRGSLEALRDMARARIKQLQEGEVFYSPSEKAHYLKVYQEKLRELDKLLTNGPAAVGTGPSASGQESKNRHIGVGCADTMDS